MRSGFGNRLVYFGEIAAPLGHHTSAGVAHTLRVILLLVHTLQAKALGGALVGTHTAADTSVRVVNDLFQVFGLKLLEKESTEIPDDVLSLADEREKARGDKNYELSDKYREMIREKGFEVRDTKDGQILEKL